MARLGSDIATFPAGAFFLAAGLSGMQGSNAGLGMREKCGIEQC